MKISTKGRYGIRLMLSLALHYDKGTLALKSIAREQDIPKISGTDHQSTDKIRSSKKLPRCAGRLHSHTRTKRYHHRRSPRIWKVPFLPWILWTTPCAPTLTPAFLFPSGKR